MSIIERFEALDAHLADRGFPRTSPWFMQTIGGFYASKRRQLVIRCGRRGGKSSTLCRVAVCEAMYGEHAIPPGDVGVIAIISVSRDEAAQRLRTIRAILDALGVAHKPIDGGLELVGRPIAFKTYAASISGVSGFTAIGVICDEVAKWRDIETGSNPATEVLASLRPTLATQRSARIFLSSSPMGSDDAHARAFDRGGDDFQCIAHAPTWVANPTITEGETHALEPHEATHRREYAAIPSDGGGYAAFPADDVAAMLRTLAKESEPLSAGVLMIDSSAGRGDGWSYCLAGYMAEPSTAPRFIVDPLPHGSPARISHVDLTRYPVFDRRTGLPMVDASGAPVTAVREGVRASRPRPARRALRAPRAPQRRRAGACLRALHRARGDRGGHPRGSRRVASPRSPRPRDGAGHVIAATHEVLALDRAGTLHRLATFPSVAGADHFAAVLRMSPAWASVKVAPLDPLGSAIAAEVDRAIGEA